MTWTPCMLRLTFKLLYIYWTAYNHSLYGKPLTTVMGKGEFRAPTIPKSMNRT